MYYLPILTATTCFRSNTVWRSWLIHNHGDKLLCNATKADMRIEPWHDPPARTVCRPFDLVKDAVMTTVGFHPANQPTSSVYFRQHMHFNYYYVAPDGVSRNTVGWAAQQLDLLSPVLNKKDVQLVLHLQHENSIPRRRHVRKQLETCSSLQTMRENSNADRQRYLLIAVVLWTALITSTVRDANPFMAKMPIY